MPDSAYWHRRLALIVLALSLADADPVAASSRLAWVTQFRSVTGNDVATDSLGGVYVNSDMHIAKFTPDGAVAWTSPHKFGYISRGYAIATTPAGESYVAGSTIGIPGGPPTSYDAVLAKYDSNGGALWQRQVGGDLHDEYYGVALDGAGNASVVGTTWRANSQDYPYSPGPALAFVRTYDPDGNLIWADDFGVAGKHNRAESISADALGNVYVSGAVRNAIYDGESGTPFIRKYDSSGSLVWSTDLKNSPYLGPVAVSADNLGNLFVAGGAFGEGGRGDTVVSRYDADGALIWSVRSNTSDLDGPSDVSADGLGNVFVSGNVFSNVAAGLPTGVDAFLLKYGHDGALLGSELLSTAATDVHDVAYGVGVDPLGNAYLTGYTLGRLAETDWENNLMFVAKFAYQVPEPPTLSLAALAGLATISFIRRKE